MYKPKDTRSLRWKWEIKWLNDDPYVGTRDAI